MKHCVMNSSAYPAIPTVEANISDILCAAKATGPVNVALDEVRIRLEVHYHSCTSSFVDAIYPPLFDSAVEYVTKEYRHNNLSLSFSTVIWRPHAFK